MVIQAPKNDPEPAKAAARARKEFATFKNTLTVARDRSSFSFKYGVPLNDGKKE